MSDESALRRTALVALRRTAPVAPRSMAELHCSLFVWQILYRYCVWLLYADSLSKQKTAGCVIQEKLKEVERWSLSI